MRTILKNGKAKLHMLGNIGKEVIKALEVMLEKFEREYFYISFLCLLGIMCLCEKALCEMIYGDYSMITQNMPLVIVINILVCYSVMCVWVLIKERKRDSD